MVDKIYLIKLFRKLNNWNTNFAEGETIYNDFFLKSLGYTCDETLCNKSILVYVNTNKNKLIVYCDGADKEFLENLEKCKSNNIYLKTNNYIYVVNEYFNYVNRVKNTVEQINGKYDNYNKLYLGYCFGGYMVNNFINGKNIKAYTYNSWGVNHNTNNVDITNYCEIFDFSNILYRNINSVILNSHTNKLKEIINESKNIFEIINLIIKNYDTFHTIYRVNKKELTIYF